ncbi:hypothetical protein BC629DRAFT_1551459 [Irpex lacteus]|nr:hypothetical protein BC629DRAFT_1551459 [Irpex lacteus]
MIQALHSNVLLLVCSLYLDFILIHDCFPLASMFAYSSFVSRIDIRLPAQDYGLLRLCMFARSDLRLCLTLVVSRDPSLPTVTSYTTLETDTTHTRWLWHLNRSRWLNMTPGQYRRAVNYGCDVSVTWSVHRIRR